MCKVVARRRWSLSCVACLLMAGDVLRYSRHVITRFYVITIMSFPGEALLRKALWGRLQYCEPGLLCIFFSFKAMQFASAMLFCPLGYLWLALQYTMTALLPNLNELCVKFMMFKIAH